MASACPLRHELGLKFQGLVRSIQTGSFAAQRLLFRDTTSFCLKVLQVSVDETRGSWMETPIRTRNEMFAENLMQVSDVDIVVFPPLTCVPHTRTGQEGPLASPFARKSGPPVLCKGGQL